MFKMETTQELCVLNETAIAFGNGGKSINCNRKSICHNRAIDQSKNSCVTIPSADRGSPAALTPQAQLLEPQIICIQNDSQHQNLTEISRTSSYFVRFREGFVKFFSKIMGSNTPSEADKYEYYDYILTKQNQSKLKQFRHYLLTTVKCCRVASM